MDLQALQAPLDLLEYMEREVTLVSKATLEPQAGILKAHLGREEYLEKWVGREIRDRTGSLSEGPLGRLD